MNEIKPCPCCGREAKAFYTVEEDIRHTDENEPCAKWWAVHCGSCPIQIEDEYGSREIAIHQWNRIVSVKPVLTNGQYEDLHDRVVSIVAGRLLNKSDYLQVAKEIESVVISVLKGE